MTQPQVTDAIVRILREERAKDKDCRGRWMMESAKRIQATYTATAELEEARAEEVPKDLPSMVLGLHALVFGTYSLQDPEYSHKALSDDGEIHEYIHMMVRALPPKDQPQ